MVGCRRDFWLSRSSHSAARCGIDCASNASHTLDYIDTSTLDSRLCLSFSGSQTLDAGTLRLLAETTTKHDEETRHKHCASSTLSCALCERSRCSASPIRTVSRSRYRRDWSNQPFFLTEQPGIFKKEQNTATFGLVWWLGRKKGAW